MDLLTFILSQSNDKSNFISDPVSYIEKNFSFDNTKTEDIVLFHQIKMVLKVVNPFKEFSAFSKKNKNNVTDTVNSLIDKLDRNKLTPLTYSFILSLGLFFYNLNTMMDWINPFEFKFINSRNSLSYSDFGYGTNIDDLSDFEIIDTVLYGINTEKAILVIPNHVTKIAKNALQGTKIQTVFIPKSVVEIEEYAFKDCSELESVISEISIKHMSKGTFENCVNLNYLNSLYDLETIGDNAFRKTNLNLYRPEKFKNKNVFKSILSNLDSIDSLTIDNAEDFPKFLSNVFIKHLVIKETVNYLPEGFFKNCIIENLDLLSTSIDFEEGVFLNSKISNITLKDNRYSIKSGFVLKGSELLIILYNQHTSIELPDFITSITKGSISNLNHLKSIYFNKNIQHVSSNSVVNCTALEKLSFYDFNANLFENDFVPSSQIKYLEFNTPFSHLVSEWFKNVIEITLSSDFNTIYPFQFSNLAFLEEITLENITAIGDYAFYSCLSLKNINLENIDFIGFGAFSNCPNIETFDFIIPASYFETLQPRTFGSYFSISKESNLVEVAQVTNSGNKNYYLPSKMLISCSSKDIPYGYFSGIKNKISFINGVQTIEEYGLSSTSIIVLDLLDQAVLKEFSLCDASSLQEINNLESATLIESNVFYNCINLISVSITHDNYNYSIKELNSLKNLENLQIKSFSDKGLFCENNMIYDSVNNKVLFVAPKFTPLELTLDGIDIINRDLMKNFKLLKSLRISNSNLISVNAFSDLDQLEELYIEESVINIENGIIENCYKLNKLQIPFLGENLQYNNAISFLDYYANLNQLSISELHILSGNIHNVSFSDMNQLVGLTYQGNDKKIGKFAFSGLNWLKSISYPNGISIIEDSAFKDCKNLNFTFGDYDLEYIGNSSFENCKTLKYLKFNEIIEYIGSNAFNNCTNVEEIEVPFIEVEIGAGAFSGIKLLNALFLPLSDHDFKYFFESGIKIKKAHIQTNNITSAFISSINEISELIIEGDYDKLPSKVFSERTDLKKLTFNNKVTNIEDGVFMDSQNLASISGLDNVEIIGNYSFFNCNSLIQISLKNATTLGNSCFKNCGSLEMINTSDKLMKIGDFSFESCISLKRISDLSSVFELGKSAFMNCKSIEILTLPKINLIRENTFKGCSSLLTFDVSNFCIIIETSSFSDCSNLKSVKIPLSVNYIDSFAFENSNELLTLYLSRRTQKKTFNKYWNYKSRSIINQNNFLTRLKLKLNDRYLVKNI